jgi:hypothetical protein
MSLGLVKLDAGIANSLGIRWLIMMSFVARLFRFFVPIQLKELNMTFEDNVTVTCCHYSYGSCGRFARMNESLETFPALRPCRIEDYLVFIDAIQPNTTLKPCGLVHR